MSIARAISKHVARSPLPYDFCRRASKHFRKKNWRNPMASNDNSAMNSPYHHAIARDISAVFSAYERDEQAEGARKQAFERLKKLVNALGNSGEYDLMDVSSDSLPEIPRFYHAPLECTIVDKTRPEGLPPTYRKAALPAAYDAIALAKRLVQNGYNGTFIDAKPDLRGYNASDPDILSKPLVLPSEPAWGQLSLPFSSISNVLPPILRIKPENAEHPEIQLSPAHPTNELRWNLLKHACESSSSFRVLTTLFWLWLRSHGLGEHFTWATCAFAVMFFLQDRSGLASNEQMPNAQLLQRGFWNREAGGRKPLYKRMAIPPMPRLADPLTHPGSMLCNLLFFWTNQRHLPHSRVLDPVTGARLQRALRYKFRTTDLDEAEVMKDLKVMASKGKHDAYWQYNPLVVKDPFLPTHNLAHRVTEQALQVLLDEAHTALWALKSGFPLIEIFGTSDLPPILRGVKDTSEWFVKSEALLNGSQASPVPPILAASSGRAYHTSARSRSRPGHAAIAAPPYVPRGVREKREMTIDRVRRAVRQRYGNQYLVECFGSTQYRVDSPTSDLDLVVLDQDRKTGFRPEVELETLPVVYNVRNLANTLERNGFRIHRVISQASVPIVKFEDPRTRLFCDININDRLGLFNTQLIAHYCSLSPLLRAMLVLIKKWAKTLGLNDPAGEGGTTTFSSYAFTLMTVGFLQAHELLPSLQSGLPPLTEDEEFWTCGKNGYRTRCDPRFNRSLQWTAPSNILIHDLRGALMAWFRFWGHQFNYSLDIMSIRDGGIIPRAEATTASFTARKQALNRKKKAEKKAEKEAKLALKASRRAEHEARTEANRKKREGVVEEVEEETAASPEVVEENTTIIDNEAANEEELLENEEDEDEEEAAAEDAEQAAHDEMDEADLQRGRQPRSWSHSALVVADPFIVAKNVTGQIIPFSLLRFTSECKRSLLLLSEGADFEDLLGDGSVLRGKGKKTRLRKGRKLEKVMHRLEEQRRREINRGKALGFAGPASRNGSESRRQSVERPERQRSRDSSNVRQENGDERPQSRGRYRSAPGTSEFRRPMPIDNNADANVSADREESESENGKGPKYHSGRGRGRGDFEPGRWTKRSMAARQAQAQAQAQT